MIPLTPRTSPDGGSGDSISLAQEARKLDAIDKVNETRKRNQKKKTKRETKIATHAKSHPSRCGICKEAFTSRNALFKHLDEKLKSCREWQQQPEVKETTSPRACDGSHTNPCLVASSWQIQRKDHSSSVDRKRSMR